MSLPTTPARSIARSTISTPSTSRHGTSPQKLTPRSKVKAMLAAIDDDDSDTNLPSEPTDRSRAPLSSIAGNARKVRERDQLEPKAALNSEGSENGDDDEEEDEEPLFIPRGRLAARLKGQNTARDDSSAGQEDSLEENAYNRIRKKLLSRGSKIERETHEEDENDVEATGEKGQPEFECQQEPVGLPSEDVQSPARSPRSTPGLFLTPEKAPISQTSRNEAVAASGSDSDLPSDPHSNNRVQELVARVRAEREAKQAKQDELRKERIAKQRSFEKELSRDASSGRDLSDEDKLTDRRLTQQSRPTRKASKKAVEEMNRETQRMSRNMQLAHQARTKKKITKDSLFARFNFRTSGTPVAEAAQQLSSSTADSSAPASDMEVIPDQQSPPTSPIDADEHSVAPLYHDSNKHNVNTEMEADPAERQDELPSMLEIMTQSHHVDKGKGKEVDHAKNQTTSNIRESKKTVFTQPPLKIRPPNPFSRATDIDLDSDSDLEISFLKKPRSKRDVFDRLPASKVQEGRSLQTLRALAHLTSPNKQMRGKKATMSLSDMQTSLQRRARQQAVEERAAKIEDLERRGIIVQTAEERQQDQAEVEDLLEKARREGEEIMQKEKRAAKKAKIANGEVDDLPDSSDEDEDYHDNQGDEPEVELSGSEEDEEIDVLASVAEDSANEDDAEGGGISLEEDRATTNGFVDDAASEDGDDEHDEGIETDDGSDEDDGFSKAQIQRPRRNKMVIDDDDDEQVEEKPRTPTSPAVEVPQFPKGQTGFGVVPMGMTQAFAATMADTQTQSCEDDQEQDSMALLDTVPEPNFPLYDNNDSLQMIEDSQNDLLQPETNTSKEIDLHFSQSLIQIDTLGDTQDLVMASQISEIPDPTQDVGFVLSSPAPQRLASEPPSTVNTVLLSGASGNTSPIKKRGRLQRRAPIEEDISDLDESQAMTLDRDVINDTTNAFDAMRKARKASKAVAAKEAFDRKKSEAKGMVEEQAQESEDEYAGLGGASDEDSGEEDEDVNAMMDHGEVKVDERRLAQLFADKERARDEKAVEKLYKDINSGMLRRKRGADFDLSDSDDDAEAKRRRKQREFAKMRKAMLADENVGKIAEDSKKLAFLQTIEDRENDDDLDFLDRPAEDSFRVEIGTQEDPESQSPQPALPAPAPKNRKQPLQDSTPDTTNMRPPATARRTAGPKKPATLAEIRESVSFLTEDPGSIAIALDPSSSASEDDENPTRAPARNPRRTPANPIIDRLSLKRADSSSTSSNASRLAFQDPTANPAIGGFKVPSLLRRATTSQLGANGADANGISTVSEAAATERAAGGEKGGFVRRGGRKGCSVNFLRRESEKRVVVEGVERRRREERERVGRERGGGLGGLGVGRFE